MIEIIQGGIQTSLQDDGRPGHRGRGIPGGGAADKLSFALANWLAGNKWNSPALESTLGGLHLKVHKKVLVGLAGAQMWAQVNGQNVANFTAFPMKAGDILTLSFPRQGCRAYVAVSGGLEGDQFLGSQATYIPAALGGIGGRAVKAGDRFLVKDADRARRQIPTGYVPHISNHAVLRARPGPEFYDLTLASQRHLFVSPFHSTDQTDRMGSRLRGDRIMLSHERSMISGPMLPGTLQVPPEGGPILALVDGHCTGGYPRALQVIRADHWQMGQIGPQMQVSFRRSFADEAEITLRNRNAHYGSLIDGFKF